VKLLLLLFVLQAFKKLRADLGPFPRAVHSSPMPHPAAAAAAATPPSQQQQQQQGHPATTGEEGAMTTAAAAAALGGSLHGGGTYLGGSMGQLLGGLGGLGTQHGSALSLSDLFKMDEDTQVGRVLLSVGGWGAGLVQQGVERRPQSTTHCSVGCDALCVLVAMAAELTV
jgi:hypothetical protein